MSMFGKAKEQFDLVKKAKEIQNKLKSQVVTGESGPVKIVFNGELKVQKVEIDSDEFDPAKLEVLEKDIKAAVEKAVTKSQEIGAELMKEMGGLGGLGL